MKVDISALSALVLYLYVQDSWYVRFIRNVKFSAEFLTDQLHSLRAADLPDLFNPEASKLCTY
jgi:hypothetical protein